MKSVRNIKKADMHILAAGSDCRLQVADLLRTLGYSALSEAADGINAWNHLKQHEVDVVFADWTLGQFDGLALLKIMTADDALSKIPVVLMSTTINREMVIDAGHAGVSAVLVPPFSPEVIGEKLDSMFAIIQEQEKDIAAEAVLQEGLDLMQRGEYTAAMEKFTAMLGMYENPEVYYNIGYIKASQKRYDESIRAFRIAIKIDQKYARAYRALAEVYLKTGRTEEAEAMMQRAGEIYMEQNMTREAETAFHEVLKLNPNTTNIYNSLGILYRRTGDYEKAIQAYEKALRVDPEDENIFFNLGRACCDAGAHTRARVYLDRALELCPEFDEARELLQSIAETVCRTQ